MRMLRISRLETLKNLLLCTAGIALLLQVLTVAGGWKTPGSDVFLFKEAGVNLAQKGNFSVANLPHLPADQAMTYSYYPPLYPLLYSLWTKTFGLGLRPSLAFDLLGRWLRTLALGLLFGFFARYTPAFRFNRLFAFSLGALLLFSWATTENDRPDEWAIAAGLAAYWFSLRGKDVANLLWVTTLLAISALFSPAAGVFFGVGLNVALWRHWNWPRRIAIGAGAVVLYLLVTTPLRLSDPTAAAYFGKQVQLSVLPFLEPWQRGEGLGASLRQLLVLWNAYWQRGSSLVFCVGLLSAVGLYCWKKERVRSHLSAFALWAVIWAPLSALIWNLQPFYTWFSISVLVLYLSTWVLIRERGANTWIMAGLFLALSPLLWKEVKLSANGLALPRAELTGTIQSKALMTLPPGSRIAITPDQYFTFRPYFPVANIAYVCERLRDFDFVYVTRTRSASRSISEPLEIPCEVQPTCFEPMADWTSHKVFSVLGQKTPYYVKGNGGFLYRNTHCVEPNALAYLTPQN